MPAFPQKKGDILIYPSLKNHQLLRPMPKQPAVFFQGLSKQQRNLVIVQFPILIGLQVHEVFGASENFWGVFAASPENCQPHCAEEKNQQNRTLRFCTEICALGLSMLSNNRWQLPAKQAHESSEMLQKATAVTSRAAQGCCETKQRQCPLAIYHGMPETPRFNALAFHARFSGQLPDCRRVCVVFP